MSDTTSGPSRTPSPARLHAPLLATSSHSAPATLRRRRVLIVDDDPMVMRMFNRVLSRRYDTVEASGAPEALRMLEAGEQFDCILCDVNMPELTGPQFYARLSRSAARHLDRLLFISGGTFGSEAALFIEGVGATCLEKPISNATLLRAVGEVADRKD